MNVTVIYAAILSFLYLFLSFRVIKLRRKLKIGIGDSNNLEMTRAMRVHSNFSEYVPFTLLLIYFCETLGAPYIAVHVLCILLLVGRVSHAYGVSQEKENFTFRISGIALTFTVLSLCALYILFIKIVD